MEAGEGRQPGPVAGGLLKKAHQLERAGNLEDALEAVRVVTRLAPDNEEAWSLLARLCEETGDVKGAERAYRKLAALRLEPVQESSGAIVCPPSQRTLSPEAARKLAFWAAALALFLCMLGVLVWQLWRSSSQTRREYSQVRPPAYSTYTTPGYTGRSFNRVPAAQPAPSQSQAPAGNSSSNAGTNTSTNAPRNSNGAGGQASNQSGGARQNYLPPPVSRPRNLPVLPDLFGNSNLGGQSQAGGRISAVPPPNFSNQPGYGYGGANTPYGFSYNYYNNYAQPQAVVPQYYPARPGGQLQPAPQGQSTTRKYGYSGKLKPAEPQASPQTSRPENGSVQFTPPEPEDGGKAPSGTSESGTTTQKPDDSSTLRPAVPAPIAPSPQAGPQSPPSLEAGLRKQAEADQLYSQGKYEAATAAYKEALADLFEAKLAGVQSARLEAAIKSCQAALKALGGAQ